MTISVLTLWDSAGDPPDNTGIVYCWAGYSERDSIRSLPRYVETHGERLRRKYLKWIHELGESRIKGKRVIDHYAIEDGMSYWWMTLFVEKSPWKSPAITDAVRLFALEEILVREKPGQLRLVSANRNLHAAVRDLCKNLGVTCELKVSLDKTQRQFSFKGVYMRLPKMAQAAISLIRYIYLRWPFSTAEKPDWFSGNQSIFICSYFFHVDIKQAEEGHFHSRYWENMHDLLRKLGLSVNWLQLYYPHEAVSTSGLAMDMTGRFNQRRKDEGFHAFIDVHLSWSVLYRVIKRWCRLLLITLRLDGIEQAFRPAGSHFSLWPLMRSDWHDSMFGPVAVGNTLWLELFDEALRLLPHQKKGMYLCEGQSWERALIQAWRKHGHGLLIGVAHSTMRFWDMRYFFDPCTVRSSGPYPLPQPDFTALNGKAAISAFLGMDYPQKAIFECEALRYGYLDGYRASHLLGKEKGSQIKVLILGDHMSSGTIKMLKLLEAATPLISAATSYTMKPHPNFMIRMEDYPSLNLSIVTAPLAEIMHEYDIAYSGNLTSAAVDAFVANLPVVVLLDEGELNMSPLRGQPCVTFVSTPGELADALQKVSEAGGGNIDNNAFFFLDAGLPRWRRLLNYSEPQCKL